MAIQFDNEDAENHPLTAPRSGESIMLPMTVRARKDEEALYRASAVELFGLNLIGTPNISHFLYGFQKNGETVIANSSLCATAQVTLKNQFPDICEQIQTEFGILRRFCNADQRFYSLFPMIRLARVAAGQEVSYDLGYEYQQDIAVGEYFYQYFKEHKISIETPGRFYSAPLDPEFRIFVTMKKMKS